MNWYIGQSIVAIKNSSCGRFKKGDEFVIKSLRSSWCTCLTTQIDVGLIISGPIVCARCGIITNSHGVGWKSEVCFAPLDQDISELTEILETTQPFEL